MRRIRQIFCLLFAAVLSGCSGDEERMPISEGVGLYPSGNVSLMANGIKISFPFSAMLEKTGNLTGSIFDGDMVLESSFVMAPSDASPEKRYIVQLNPVVHARGTDSDIILEGKNQASGGIEYTIEGNASVSPKGERKLDISLDYELTSSPLVGRTFEMDFDDGSIYPEIVRENPDRTVTFQGEVFTPSQTAEYIFREMNKYYVLQSGYSGARFTFNPDCTIDLHFRKADTGEYVKSEYTHRYLATDTGVFFIDEAEFIMGQAPFYNISPTVLAQDTVFRQQSYVFVMGIMYMLYELRPDGTLRMEWVPNTGVQFPTLAWHKADFSFIQPDLAGVLVNNFINIVPEYLEIRPMAIAHEI